MNHFESEKGSMDEKESADFDLNKLTPKMRMQAELAVRFYGISRQNLTEEDYNTYVFKWVEYNNHEFSAGFRKILDEHPELLDEYQKEPAAALGKIEELLHVHTEALH